MVKKSFIDSSIFLGPYIGIFPSSHLFGGGGGIQKAVYVNSCTINQTTYLFIEIMNILISFRLLSY